MTKIALLFYLLGCIFFTVGTLLMLWDEMTK